MAEVKLSDIIKVGDVIRYKNRPTHKSVFKIVHIFKEKTHTYILTDFGPMSLNNLNESCELIKKSETQKDIEEWLK